MSVGNVSIPSYPPFDPDDEISSLPQKFEEWSDGLEDLMATCGITDHQRKWSTLKFFGGDKLRKVEKQLTYDKDAPYGADPTAQPAVPGTVDNYKRLKEALTAHFAPCVNETYARFQFRSITQEEGESTDTFVTRLRTQASRCNFHADDYSNQIRDQIVFGCFSKKIRRKALAENYALDRLIQVARAEESARANAAEMEKSTDSQNAESVDVLKVARKPGKYSARANVSITDDQKAQDVPNPPKRDNKCFNCGGPFPHRNKLCPAKGKTCNKCSRPGHFASVCRGKKNVLAAAASLDSSDDYDVTGDLGEVKCLGSLIDKPHCVDIETDGGKIVFNPDTGADVTLIDFQTYSRLSPKPSLRGTRAKLMPYGAVAPLQLAGVYSASLRRGSKTVREDVYIAKTSGSQVSLLSRSASRALGLVTLNFLENDVHLLAIRDPEGTNDHPLLKDFPDICKGVGCHKDLAISLPLREGAKHSVAPASRIPINLLPKVKAEVDRLESEGVFESVPVDDNVQSISRLVPVPKRIENPGSDSKSVGVRITFDWRELNKNLEQVHHQVLTVEELKAVLVGAKVFSQVDLKDAFYQLPLDEESKRLTTFSTPWGLKRSTRLVQGATPSSAICHEVLRRDLEGIPGAINIADNILVFGRGDSQEEAQKDHDRTLMQVFEMFRRTGMTINKKKCVFNATRTKFFGYVFSADGISPDPDKVAALQRADPPASKEEVRSFLGLAGFNSQFVPDYATASEPLRMLTRKNVVFRWGEAQVRAFRALTNAISESTLLSYYDPKKETALFTDASPVGVNAILAQMDENGRYRPVNIASRALTETEQGYDQIEREAVAMHFGCKRFKIFLQGIPFKHFIDPEPLKSMMEKTKKEAPARVEKVRLKLQGFNSSIELVKGKHNPADYLSRHPLPYNLCSKAERESFCDIQNHLFLVANKLPEAITVPRVRDALKSDAVISKVMNLLRAGVRRCPEERHLAPFKSIWQELSIGMGILLRGERVVLPQALVGEALDIAHKGHMGIAKTKHFLRTSVWFPKMDAQAEALVKRCLPCQAVTPETHREPLQMTPLPNEPWETVAADIFGPLPNGDKILVAKCLRSKWPEVKIFSRSQSMNANGVISAMEAMFASHGIPDVIRTDNGPPFNSKCFREFSHRFGFQHQKVTPLWPEANGQVEAFMKCLGKVARTALVEGRPFKMALNEFLMAYRATPHPSTGVSPAQLMFPGRRFRTRLPHVAIEPLDNDAVAKFNKEASAKAKKYADEKRRVVASSFSVGDTVLVRQQKRNKLTPYYCPRPYKIISLKNSMVSARRGDHIIVRNSSYFKKVELRLSPSLVPDRHAAPAAKRIPSATPAFFAQPASGGAVVSTNNRPTAQSASGRAVPLSDEPIAQSASGRAVPSNVPIAQSASGRAVPSDVPIAQSASGRAVPSNVPIAQSASGRAVPSRDLPIAQSASGRAVPSNDVPIAQSASGRAVPSRDVPIAQSASGRAVPSRDVPIAQSASGGAVRRPSPRDRGAAQVDSDSAEEFVDAEDVLANQPEDGLVQGGAETVDIAPTPRVGAYHPSSRPNVRKAPFSLPRDIKPPDYNLRPRPE